MASSLLILGGARSGKSRFAIAEHARARRVTFIATAEVRDADMASRIARHRAERPASWTTIEEPLDVVGRMRELEGKVDAIIVDCLTLWVSNRLLRGEADEAIVAEAEALASLLPGCRCAVTVVSNEVGEGVHPPTAVGLRFRDLLGLVNQRIAAAADRVVFMIAGLPLTMKTPPPANDFAAQAP